MINEIVVKKVSWNGTIDHITLIVTYASGKVVTQRYMRQEFIPYTFRDFLSTAEIEDVREIIPADSSYSILQTTYRRVRINETM